MTSQSWPWLGKGQGLDPPRMSSSSQQVKTWLDTHIWVWATPNRIFHDLPKTNWWSNQFQTSCSSNLGMQSSVTFLWQWCLGQCWRACKVEVVRPDLILIHKRFEDVDSDSDIFFKNLPCLQRCALHASAKMLLPKARPRGTTYGGIKRQWQGRIGLGAFSVTSQWCILVMPLQDVNSVCLAVLLWLYAHGFFTLTQIKFLSKRSKFASSFKTKWDSISLYCNTIWHKKCEEGLRQVWQPL